MKHMIIDIGSNSVKYDIFQIINHDFIKVAHRSTVMGFLSYLENGVLSELGVAVLCDILNEFKNDGKTAGCSQISAFATASFRSCSNPQELIDKVYEKTGLKIVLFSGEEEGNMSFLGVLQTHPEIENGIMFDMGGGSTEVNIFENRKSIFIKSLPFGALFLKNIFAKSSLPPTDVKAFATKSNLDAIYNYVIQTAKELNIPKNTSKNALMVGGSARYIGALCSKPDDDGIVRFNKDILGKVIDKYSEIDEEKADFLIKNVPNRHLLIIPAAVAYKAVFDYMGIESLTVAKGGIREGYMDYLLKNTH